MVAARWLVDHFSLQTVKVIAVFFEITDDETVDETHHALDQKFHGSIVRRQLLTPLTVCPGLRDVTQEDHRIFRILDFTTHDDVTHPAFLAIQDDTAFLTQLRLESL